MAGVVGEHHWVPLVEGGPTKLFTCDRCGLFRLETLSGSFFLLRWSGKFAQCATYPYRDHGADDRAA